MKTLLALLFALGATVNAYSQSEPDWFKLMTSDNPNFFEVEEAYKAYYEENEFRKNRFTQDHKRWVREIERFVQPDGNIRIPSTRYEDKLAHFQQNRSSERGGSGWQPIGPFHVDTDAPGNSYAPGFTRFNTVEQDPVNAQIVYGGTATNWIVEEHR